MPTLEDWLTGEAENTPDELPPILVAQVRLFFGVSLVRSALYDEAEHVLAGIKPDEVIDPAALLFYRAVALHQLLKQKECIRQLEKLQTVPEDAEDAAQGMMIPKRYASLVRIMLSDMESLDAKSLEHISRRMDDIRRRLDFGRAGEKVQEVERGVIESLDDLIKKLEEEEKKKKQQQSQGNNQRPQNPALQPYLPGGNAPGNVDRKNIAAKGGWGNLPPKEREESLQQIGRDFPPHYRDAIEQYFRRLAENEE